MIKWKGENGNMQQTFITKLPKISLKMATIGRKWKHDLINKYCNCQIDLKW